LDNAVWQAGHELRQHSTPVHEIGSHPSGQTDVPGNRGCAAVRHGADGRLSGHAIYRRQRRKVDKSFDVSFGASTAIGSRNWARPKWPRRARNCRSFPPVRSCATLLAASNPTNRRARTWPSDRRGTTRRIPLIRRSTTTTATVRMGSRSSHRTSAGATAVSRGAEDARDWTNPVTLDRRALARGARRAAGVRGVASA